MSKKKKWSSEAKFKIVIEVLKGDLTLNELCNKYSVAPSQVHAWKRQLLEQGPTVFDKSSKEAKAAKLQAAEQKELYTKIGTLTVERDFLKECWGKLQVK
jgi:transposase